MFIKKNLFLIIMIIIGIICVCIDNCHAQKKWNKPFFGKNDALIYSMQIIAGSADGLNQVLVHHPHTFERIWSNANMNWWLPEKSQWNKEHFITIFSDGMHTTRTIEHTMNYTSIGISFLDIKDYSKKQLVLVMIKKAILSFVSNRIGFKIWYNGIFNDKKEHP